MAAYCTPDDLVLGDIPLPSYLNPAQKVQDAADEIDSHIGRLYQTPIDVTESGPLDRPARLFLKRVNAHLASGRILLAIAAPQENKNLHAYGYSLVQEALAAITSVVSGDLELEGATPLDDSAGEAVTVPMINNLDAESNVEAYYNRATDRAILPRGFADRPLW